MEPNDGVQWVGSTGRFMSIDAESLAVTSWLPPLYPYQWQIWIGAYDDRPQVSICLYKPQEFSQICRDKWNECVARGSFKEMWPLFLTYVNMMNRGEE